MNFPKAGDKNKKTPNISLRCAINTLKQMSNQSIEKEEAHVIRFKTMSCTSRRSESSAYQKAKAGLIAQGLLETQQHTVSSVIESALASVAKKDEHCEMSPEGKLLAVNVALGHQDVQELLQHLLDEMTIGTKTKKKQTMPLEWH